MNILCRFSTPPYSIFSLLYYLFVLSELFKIFLSLLTILIVIRPDHCTFWNLTTAKPSMCLVSNIFLTDNHKVIFLGLIFGLKQ
jgi:presenilin-like A22 family membrane protease